MTRIAPNLYVGALWNAVDARKLAQAGVTLIVSMAVEHRRLRFPVRTQQFPLHDDAEEFAMPMFLRSVVAIDAALMASEVVLVCCGVGRSRSVAAVIAYLVAANQISVHAACDRVLALRPHAAPNHAYLAQLGAFEHILLGLSIPVFAIIGTYLWR